MSDLPKDLEEEMLSKVPMRYIRKVRLTCKRWNTLSRRRYFAKKHLGHEATSKKFMVAIILDFRIHLMNINLHNSFESCIQREGKLISLDNSYEVDLSKVFHCDGLLLCITKDHTKLVVWNPYWGQTRCLPSTLAFHRYLERYSYVIGYNKSSLSYKILTFVDRSYPNPCAETKIYDLNSNSWRVLDAIPGGQIDSYYHVVSFKGDTYWFGRNKLSQVNAGAFLVSFDFTKEKFGPLLPLPFEWFGEDVAILSTIREEKLAVLFHGGDTLTLEIWITTKIKPNAVSWCNKLFLSMDMKPFISYQFSAMAASFFIDEEKEVAVVFDKERDDDLNPTHNVAFIVGVDGSLKKEYLGESSNENICPRACSYVPNLVQLN